VKRAQSSKFPPARRRGTTRDTTSTISVLVRTIDETDGIGPSSTLSSTGHRAVPGLRLVTCGNRSTTRGWRA
jgi:hypothetical protein